MGTCVALLRAVNLGGTTQVGMDRLRSILEADGFGAVRTLLQSGNVVFEAADAATAALESRLEGLIDREFGRRTDVFVRTSAEWRGILAANPFPQEAADDPAHLVVTVLRTAPTEAAWKALTRAIEGRERATGIGRTAYLVYPDGIGRSKLTATRIERALGTTGTSRNWNTVGRIATALGV